MLGMTSNEPVGSLKRFDEAGVRRQCRTCWRYRPAAEFRMTVTAELSYSVKICRLCREKLWVNPGDPNEGR